MTETMTYTGILAVVVCCDCHMSFAVPADFQRRCREAGPDMTFHCPAGHSQYYATSEAQRLRDQLASANRRLGYAETAYRFARDQADAAERTARAYKGHLTRARKRIGNGVCPCCNRHFANVERHMSSRHPGYAGGGAEE